MKICKQKISSGHTNAKFILSVLGIIIAAITSAGIWYNATKNSTTNLDSSIQQQTNGDNSSALSNIEGNVTIIQKK